MLMMSIEIGALFFLLLVILGVIGFFYLLLRLAFTVVRLLAEGLANLIGWIIRPFTAALHPLPGREHTPGYEPGISGSGQAEALQLCPRPHCGNVNPAHSRFCARCGLRLE